MNIPLPHQLRVLVEHDELQTKCDKLTDWIQSVPFQKLESYDQKLLLQQLTFMRDYLDTLNQRIARF